MKIAISGTAGIGKSSLAKALADKLRLPLIAENYETLFDKPKKITDTGQLAEAILRILESKQQLEEQHGSFVTDRCPIDLFHLWMKTGLWVRQQETERLYNMAVQQVDQYDLVVFPPSGILAADSEHETRDFRQRTPSKYVQMYNHASIIGLALLWMPAERLLFLPGASQSVDERAEAVIRTLTALKG